MPLTSVHSCPQHRNIKDLARFEALTVPDMQTSLMDGTLANLQVWKAKLPDFASFGAIFRADFILQLLYKTSFHSDQFGDASL